MKGKSFYTEPLSQSLRRHPHGNKTEITNTIRWVALISLLLFITLIITNLISDNMRNVAAISVGLVPIVVSILYLRKNAITAPSTILAVTIILLITWLATTGQGIHDIGLLGYPVILIVAGLILLGRVILYLAILIILCLAWLVFGDVYGLYVPVRFISGNPDDFFIASVVILTAGNTIYKLVKNVYDNLSRAEQEIAMREQAEAERESTIQQLRRKNQELDRFAIRVSHDLKTPLITLAGFLGYLEKDIKEGDIERTKKDINQINGAAKTMGKFVDELLDLSRVGRITNPPASVPFSAIVTDALKAAEGLIEAKQVKVEIGAIFPFVYVDRARIVQVMQNLITNAVKFMGDQPQPRITIGFEESEGEHIFSVRDNGIGIASEHHERIFELFNKLDPKSDGTGIGLGLVRKIIEVHHGRIWVESEPGQGSTFKFTLKDTPTINR